VAAYTFTATLTNPKLMLVLLIDLTVFAPHQQTEKLTPRQRR